MALHKNSYLKAGRPIAYGGAGAVMRNKLVFFTAFAVAIVLLTGIVSALDRRDRDVTGYNVLKERMFEGIVASKGRITEGLMYFPLRTANAMIEVQIGPKEFVDRSGFKLNIGETVTVIGMPLIVNEQQVVLAREVRSMAGVLTVRDPVGLPLWERDRPILMDPERLIRFSDNATLIR
jgi:hypothetical protein